MVSRLTYYVAKAVFFICLFAVLIIISLFSNAAHPDHAPVKNHPALTLKLRSQK